MRYDSYLTYVEFLDPTQLVICDTNSLKGSEILNKKGRDEPFGGQKMIELVSGDFWNVYCKVGMISIQNEN